MTGLNENRRSNVGIARVGLLIAAIGLMGIKARAEATFMTGPRWTQCNHDQVCFSMTGTDASTTYFAPGRLFFRRVQFKLFGRKDHKVALTTLFADSAFSSDHDKVWYLQNVRGGHDYSFDTGTMKLTRLAK